MTGFAKLGLSGTIVTALERAGIAEPFPIQALTIPDALAGRDVCGKAKTGSGKTLAFGLPLLQRLVKAEPKHPHAMVLVPTRELALQVHGVLEPVAEALDRSVVAVYGGGDVSEQTAQLARSADAIIATPGRLIDLIDRRMVSVATVACVVVDEADRMADMGFLPQVEWILRHVHGRHQTLLFSATLDGAVGVLQRRYQRDPAFHEVAPEGGSRTVETMVHRFVQVHHMDKAKVAAAIAKGAKKVLVFCRTKRNVDRVAKDLSALHVAAAAIHGDLRQEVRERALKRFAAGRLHVLVATDVAARGLHIDAVDIVIHYDPPSDPKAYIHRSGRTARAGEAGLVVSLVEWNQVFDVERLGRALNLATPIVEVFSNDPRLRDLAAWDPEPAPAA